jgi:large subunit ribosomal protein L10
MKKEQKTALVKELSDRFGRASLALAAEYSGISAAETAEMRRKVRAVSGEIRVAKNTLIRRAIQDTPYRSLEDKLGGPVGLILSFGDPIAVAKTVAGFKDLGEKFKVRGGVMGGKPLSAAEIERLATLPPREVMMAQLLGLLNAPATRLVRLLNEPGSALARLIDAIGKKNGGRGAGQAAGQG